MLTDAFTPRNVTKYVVQAVIASKVSDFAEDAIVEHTQFEEDDMIVDIATHVIGWGVSAQLKPYTDKIVDRTADFIVAKREERRNRNKKDNSEEK